MQRDERAIYTADVDNSMLELVEVDDTTSWDQFDSALTEDIAFPCQTKVEFPKRDFWKIAKRYLG